MFCRNCANPLDPNAAVCVKCGVPVGSGVNYCPKCSVALARPIPQGEQKSKMTAGLLGIFLGGLGIHNFYLGYTGKAIAQIVLSLCFGLGAIWGLVEGIMSCAAALRPTHRAYP